MNTNTTHTPGPWEMGFDPYGYRITAKAPTANLARREICKVAAYIDPNSDESANARLIANAPELLDALRELLNCIDPARDWSEARAARAAIAKAEGRAE